MKVKITSTAQSSLWNALALLSNKVSFEKIEVIADELLAEIERLVTYPELGQIEESLLYKKKKYRRLVKGNYKIIYYVESEIIYVVFFFDTRQNPNKLIV